MVRGIVILQDRQVLLCAAALSASCLLWLGASVVGREVFIWFVLCYGNTIAHAAVIRYFLAVIRMELVIAKLLREFDQGFWHYSWNLMSYGLEQVCLSACQKMGGLIDHWNVGLAVTRVSQNTQKPLICPFPLPSIDCNKWKKSNQG